MVKWSNLYSWDLVAAGRTAMEYALERRASADGYYRTADHMGRCVMSFIQARNAFAGMLQITVKTTGSRSWYEPNLLADKTMIWSLF